MKKIIAFAILFSFNAFAGSEDLLRELVKKDIASKLSGGNGLNNSDKKEYNRLSDEIGVIRATQITNEAMTGIAQRNNQLKPSDIKKTQPNIVPEVLISSQKPGALPQKVSTSTQSPQSLIPKELPKKDTPLNETRTEMPPITVVINQGSPQPPQNEGKKNDLITKEKSDESEPQAIYPQISKDTEKQLMKNYKTVAEDSIKELEQLKSTDNANAEIPVGDQIYTPSPTGTGINSPGFSVDRDSTAILRKSVSVNDSVNIDMCIAYGAAISLDESIKTTLGRVTITDDRYFKFVETPNKRGVYVSLTKPVPKDGIWLSSLMLYRKDNDLIYLINLRGRPCPDGLINFPKVVYLSEKKDRNSRLDDKYKMADAEILTPEDTIISVSKGFDRTNDYEAVVYDMVASAGSSVVTMGVEIQSITDPSDAEFRVLDFHQVTPLKTSSRFLELQSKKASEQRNQKVQRFNLTIEINKDYMLRRRYIYLMYINNKKKNYEYMMVDTAKFMKSLKDREFDL